MVSVVNASPRQPVCMVSTEQWRRCWGLNVLVEDHEVVRVQASSAKKRSLETNEAIKIDAGYQYLKEFITINISTVIKRFWMKILSWISRSEPRSRVHTASQSRNRPLARLALSLSFQDCIPHHCPWLVNRRVVLRRRDEAWKAMFKSWPFLYSVSGNPRLL